jgi:hypothetical protein
MIDFKCIRINKLADNSCPHGVFHIEKLFELSEFLVKPGDYGSKFEEKQSNPIQEAETNSER